MIIVHFGF